MLRARTCGAAALVAAAGALLACAPVAFAASGVPQSGRWAAQGAGGARVTFLVLPASGRRLAVDVVVYCRSNGQPMSGNWSEGVGHIQTLIGRNGRIEPLGGPQPALQGRLEARSGVVSSAQTWAGADGCADADYRRMRARYVGPVIARDGQWAWTGSLGSSGMMDVYGGGALIRMAGTFVGPPPPAYPELGPCLVTLPGLFGPRFSVPISANGGFRTTLTSSAFGIVSRVSIHGRIASPTRLAAVNLGFFTYGAEYTCSAPGLFAATLVRPAPRYEPYYTRGQHDPKYQPRLPQRPRQRFPRSGLERDGFRCDFRRPAGPNDLCRAYPRKEGPMTHWVQLKWGNAKRGFRHIRARRGFSTKTDRYIARTVASGKPTPQGRGTRYERTYHGAGRTCEYRVIDAGEPKGIISAYVIEPSKRGYVSLCP